MALTYRSVKGSGLTNEEIDANTAEIATKAGVDGWTPSIGAWTCTTAGVAGSLTAAGALNVNPVAAVFTIPGDVTTTYFRGVRVKWTQTTVKYGYVNSSSYSAGTGLTTVTLIANADYQMGLSSGTAITLPAFSFGSPSGFPDRFNYVGAVSPGSGALTTITATETFTMIGKTVIAICSIALTDAGTGTGGLNIAVPVAAVNNLNTGYGREVAASGHLLNVGYNGSMNVYKYDATGSVNTGYTLSVTFPYQ